MNKYDYRISTVDLKTDLLIVFLSLINSYTRNIIIFYITTLKIISHVNNNYYKIIIQRIIQYKDMCIY